MPYLRYNNSNNNNVKKYLCYCIFTTVYNNISYATGSVYNQNTEPKFKNRTDVIFKTKQFKFWQKTFLFSKNR